MLRFARSLKLRISDWLFIGFFFYIALISPFFPARRHLGSQPLVVLGIVFVLLSLLARAERTKYGRVFSIVHDWLAIFITLLAFLEMELFLPPHYNYAYELAWIQLDRLLLNSWHLRDFVQSLGSIIPFYLELCYLFVYGVAAVCIGILYHQLRRRYVDIFLTIYLAGTLTAYGLFPYFPSQPPRVAFPGMDNPDVNTWIRQINLYILGHGSIHSGVFPSAHVSSVFSAAWAMFLLLPKRKFVGWALFFYGISVSVATVYGRYHYAADVLAGFAVSLVAGLLCLIWRAVPAMTALLSREAVIEKQPVR